MPTEGGLTVEAAVERFDTLQAQISKMAVEFDAFRVDITSRIPAGSPFLADDIQKQIDTLTERLGAMASNGFPRASRWDARPRS